MELGPASDKNINDTDGLEKVLPQIRKLAPWIPAACISRFITGSSEIIGPLSESDFDGIYPKEIISKGTITHPEFNAQRWFDMLRGMKIKRVAAMTGMTVDHINDLLRNSEGIKLKLSEGINNEKEINEQKIIQKDLLQHPLEVTKALIHGDFHLRNILIKDNSPKLIDFARSDYGPIAIDAAKLIIDIIGVFTWLR